MRKRDPLAMEQLEKLQRVEKVECRHFQNPFPDFVGGKHAPFEIDVVYIKKNISTLVENILEDTDFKSNGKHENSDLYTGNAGIAYMFCKLYNCEQTRNLYPALEHAAFFIRRAKTNMQHSKKRTESYNFICGSAGVYAVSAFISQATKNAEELSSDLANFKTGMDQSTEFVHTKLGSDDFLAGRAGYLSGCYWLNKVLPGHNTITDKDIILICKFIIACGRGYSQFNNSPLPLLYHYFGTEYLGAAHGICSILHMLLECPWFRTADISAPGPELRDIKWSLDYFVSLQDEEGNFPISLEDLRTGRKKRLVQWCHGAPGVVYLLAKAFLVFKEEKYLKALRRAADFVWECGYLRKGPGMCHGLAGNGYVFLLLFRLTKETKYLYRAHMFMELVNHSEFKSYARVPDNPNSLFEGMAGTICFLIDLLEPDQAHFPFMDVFH